MKVEANQSRVKQIKGIGDKTADYLLMLSGEQNTAIDRHLINFLRDAGIDIHIAEYDRAHLIISAAAGVLGMKLSVLDHSIWNYKAKKSRPC